MHKIEQICAIVLALPLIAFGLDNFVPFLPSLPDDGSLSLQLIKILQDGGLMDFIAISHILFGSFLLIPRLRTFGALLQLPLSVGVLCFHISMHPDAMIFAAALVILNLGAAANLRKITSLMA